ncbi:hypothetical protein GQ600_14588 [Phytophthora cactorum]|nr:hypothetical protein GQ600_14588 [Phytophthora cactorum]
MYSVVFPELMQSFLWWQILVAEPASPPCCKPSQERANSNPAFSSLRAPVTASDKAATSSEARSGAMVMDVTRVSLRAVYEGICLCCRQTRQSVCFLLAIELFKRQTGNCVRQTYRRSFGGTQQPNASSARLFELENVGGVTANSVAVAVYPHTCF